MTVFALAHIVAGTLAVLTGLAALLSRKGGKRHRKAGRIFVASMVLTAGGGAFHAIDRPETLTAIVGLLTCYLVLSSLHAVWPRSTHARLLDRVALLTALLLAGAFFVSGATAPPLEPLSGITPAVYHFFGGIALLAAAGDLASAIRGGLKGRWRIARHLWRMGFALYIAAGSLFDGPGTPIFPESLQGTRWLTIPVDAIALAVLAWLGLVLFDNRRVRFGDGRFGHTSRPLGIDGAAKSTTDSLGDAR